MVAAQSSPVSGFVFAAAGAVAGQAGLGALLTAAFVLQVTPSLWTAYRTARPTGISSGTWLLIPGASGIIVSTLMLARIYRATRGLLPANG